MLGGGARPINPPAGEVPAPTEAPAAARRFTGTLKNKLCVPGLENPPLAATWNCDCSWCQATRWPTREQVPGNGMGQDPRNPPGFPPMPILDMDLPSPGGRLSDAPPEDWAPPNSEELSETEDEQTQTQSNPGGDHLDSTTN